MPPCFEKQNHKATRALLAVVAYRAAFHKITGKQIPSQWNPLGKSSVVKRVVTSTEKLMEAKIRPYPWAVYRLSQIIDKDASVGMATGRFSSVFGTTCVSKKNLEFYLCGEIDNKLTRTEVMTTAQRAWRVRIDSCVSSCLARQLSEIEAKEMIKNTLTENELQGYYAQSQLEAKSYNEGIRARILMGQWVW